jgi:hypothetical protein
VQTPREISRIRTGFMGWRKNTGADQKLRAAAILRGKMR